MSFASTSAIATTWSGCFRFPSSRPAGGDGGSICCTRRGAEAEIEDAHGQSHPGGIRAARPLPARGPLAWWPWNWHRQSGARIHPSLVRGSPRQHVDRREPRRLFGGRRVSHFSRCVCPAGCSRVLDLDENALTSSGFLPLRLRPDQPLAGRAGSAVLDLAQLFLDAPAHACERAGLAVVVDESPLLGVAVVEAAHELLALRHLALEDAAHVALIADDVRREEEKQIRLLLLGALAPEQPADDGQRSEHRHLRYAARDSLLDQAADHDRLLVPGDHGRLGGALAGGRSHRLVHAGDLLGLLVHPQAP